ncbi:hypothetical protein JCM16774_2120 [Pseudoleptotrichia goodfellowii]|uniref:Uncharacterized protein n=1 Tax=Pseudoleptotrichia goodfellowii TaxID=157692 RepID=A0A510JFH5_9FUSO|nr:hypothetical protein JCM16774_2120 [Pseudoleptotrichia goodfellowii]
MVLVLKKGIMLLLLWIFCIILFSGSDIYEQFILFVFNIIITFRILFDIKYRNRILLINLFSFLLFILILPNIYYLEIYKIYICMYIYIIMYIILLYCAFKNYKKGCLIILLIMLFFTFFSFVKSYNRVYDFRKQELYKIIDIMKDQN